MRASASASAFALALALASVAGCSDTNNNVQRLSIGSPCATSGQCGTGKFFCDTSHANGYCKADCKSDSDCPSGSVCAGAGMLSPGGCHKKCASVAECRGAEGYICKTMPDDASGSYCDAPEPVGDGGA